MGLPDTETVTPAPFPYPVTPAPFPYPVTPAPLSENRNTGTFILLYPFIPLSFIVPENTGVGTRVRKLQISPRATAVLLTIASATASVASADAIDDYVTAEMAARNVPGIAVLVMRDGGVLKKQGYGLANVELGVNVTPQTIFQSASIGKQFTAAGVLLLAEDGKLSLDDPLSRHFPDSPTAWNRITIRQLLGHTSGIKDYSDEFDYRKDYTDDEMLAVMQALPLDFEPGTQWRYSNSGYLILGLLTTRLAGKHWSEFQAERLFAPLGMKTTRVISERDIVPNRSAGYAHGDHGELVNQEWVAPSFNRCADGALYFSLEDLVAWETALEARDFMRPASFEAWWTPARPSQGSRYPYGFGWFLSEQRGEPVIEHGGSWQGFRTSITRYPAQRLTVVLLANAASVEPEAMSHTIAGLVDPRLRMRTASSTDNNDEDPLALSLRRVLEAWSIGEATPGMSPTLAMIPAGNPEEITDREIAARRLESTRAVRTIGSDALSEAATDLLQDDSVRAVDLLLEGDFGSLAGEQSRVGTAGHQQGRFVFQFPQQELHVPLVERHTEEEDVANVAELVLEQLRHALRRDACHRAADRARRPRRGGDADRAPR